MIEENDYTILPNKSNVTNEQKTQNEQQQETMDSNSVAGIRLRSFEKIVSRVLTRNEGPYLCNKDSNPDRCSRSCSCCCTCCCWAPRNMYQHGASLLPPLAAIFHGWQDQLKNILGTNCALLLQLHHGNNDRAEKKYGQIQSMIHPVLCILSSLMESSSPSPSTFTIVDFCGGTGSMAISLSLLLSHMLTHERSHDDIRAHARVIVVDLKAQSLQRLHRRAANICHNMNTPDSYHQLSEQVPLERQKVQSTCIPNLFTFYGDIVSYTVQQRQPDQTIPPFHIGMALHACGEATDIALRACILQQRHTAAFVLAPCCVGKLSTETHDPHVFHATQQNIPTVTYPQSSYFQSTLNVTAMEFNHLAKAADYSSYSSMDSPTDAVRRVSQSCIDYDRLCYVRETAPHYTVLLTKMDPLWSSPKNNILVGWVQPFQQSQQLSKRLPYCRYLLETPCSGGTKDILWAMQQLNLENSPLFQHSSILEAAKSSFSFNTASATALALPQDVLHAPNNNTYPMINITSCTSSRMEWSTEEEHSVRKVIEDFCKSDQIMEYQFPPGQGAKIRKLIHHIADTYGLSHKSMGKQNSKRFIIIAKKYK